MNEELLAAYRDAIQSASDAEELEDVIESLPGEDYEEALSDEIEDRRPELKAGESIALDELTRAELIDVLETRPELRSAAIDHLDEDLEDHETSQGEGGDPPRAEGQPSQGTRTDANDAASDDVNDDAVTDAKDDWESAGSTDLDTTGDPDGEWDGTDALDQLFDLAENEDGEIDSETVRRGVAAYDTSSDGQNKEDYKGPFAVVQDGEPVAHLAGADSLKQMASQMDVPESVQEDAEELADSYLPEDDDGEGDDTDAEDTGSDDTAAEDTATGDATNDDLRIEDQIELSDDLDGRVEINDGQIGLRDGAVFDDAALSTLVDAAEGLGIDVSGDPDPESLIATINDTAKTLDGCAEPDSEAVDARVLFRRLGDYNITT